MNLEPNDYWKLRAINSDLERDQAAVMALQNRLEMNRAKRQQFWLQIVEKYKLDKDGNYSADDENCALNLSTNGREP